MGEETGEELDGFTGQGEGLELVVVEWLDGNLSEVGMLGEVTRTRVRARFAVAVFSGGSFTGLMSVFVTVRP